MTSSQNCQRNYEDAVAVATGEDALDLPGYQGRGSRRCHGRGDGALAPGVDRRRRLSVMCARETGDPKWQDRSDGSELAIRSAVSGPPAPECQPRSCGAMRERLLLCSLWFFAVTPGARDRRLGVPERPTGCRHSGCPRTGDRGGRCPSAGVGFRVLDVQPVEELLSCPFGPEHVKGRVLPVLRNDLVFALGL